MEGKSGIRIAQAVKRYFKEVGIPMHLICDRAKEQVRGDARILCNEVGCHVRELEKGTSAANRAERAIKTLKDGAKNDLFRSNAPLVLWCYCIERRADIINCTIRSNYMLQGQIPHSMMTGQPTDISNICEYAWYEWVIYRIEGAKFPVQHQRLGRVLGSSHNAGSTMSQWVLTVTGDVMPIQTLRRLTPGELNSPSMRVRQKEFDEAISSRVGHCMKTPPSVATGESTYPESDLQDENPGAMDIVYKDYEGLYDEPKQPLIDADEVPDYDKYIGAEVMLPKDGEHLRAARVIGQAKDADGNTIGKPNSNPMLNTRIYDVMFPDGSLQQYAANTIAENIYSQVDEDGHRYSLLDCIIGHRTNDKAVRKND